MRIRTVMLISIWSVVAGALLVGYILVNYATREHIEARTVRDLTTHLSTLRAFNRLQLDELGKTAELYAETPRLKAVTELGDSNTISQLISDLDNSIRADFLAVSDEAGRMNPDILSDANQSDLSDFLSPADRRSRGSVLTRVVALDSNVFRIASAPIRVGTDVIGRLVVGFRITGGQLRSLKEMIGSDLMLLAGDHIAGSTFAGEELSQMAAWLGIHGSAGLEPSGTAGDHPPITLSEELFKATSMRMNDSMTYGPSATVRLLILKPIRRETEIALAPVIRSFIVLSIVVLVVTIVVGLVVSKSVTKPIADLVSGTAEISRGNYDYAIQIPRGQELKFLATQFGEMSRSLKEKVQQLGQRNKELEMALRKLREMQEELIRSERLAATGKLTAQLSHEINNPVHNILSSLQTAIKKTSPDAPARELLDVAYEEVGRLARLTAQLLSVYRESVSTHDTGSAISVNEVLRDVVTSSMESLRKSNVRVDLVLGETIPPVRGSSDKLKQLFVNLVNNARDAMPDGGRLTITSSPVNGNVVVNVTDTGIGIPRENINRIFDAFFTTKGKVSGTGLGLSVSYGIVQLHRGKITVRSEPGRGSTFSVSIPAHITDQHPEQT